MSVVTKTDSQFNSMLKTYMPYELLNEDLKRRNYFWNKVKKDQNWRGANGYASISESNGGTLIVPFEGAEASSMSFGNLTASNDVAQAAYVRGQVDSYRELWGTMKFYEKDLDMHTDMKVSFLKNLPSKIDQFNGKMSERISHSLLNGNWVVKVTDATNAATGIMIVDHPERVTIGEKFSIDDDNSNAAVVYVTAINMNTKALTLSDTRGGAALNVSAYTVAQNAALYTPGIYDGNSLASPATYFTSLPSTLLSSANGGTTTLYGVTKTSYPFLQAVNISGASITSDNLLEKLFDAFVQVITLGKGMPTTILCSMKHFAAIAKSLEPGRQFTATDKAAGYGWRSVSVLGPEGSMDIVGIRDLDDDKIMIVDWNAFKFHGSNFFDRKRHLDGNEFFLERAVYGYTYIVDVRFFGDLVVNRPANNGIIHSISY